MQTAARPCYKDHYGSRNVKKCTDYIDTAMVVRHLKVLQ